jgi:hypothetical protein
MNDKSKEHQDLVKELRELDKKIQEFELNDEERKRERMNLLHKYNDTKDYAQKILGALAENEQCSTGVLYKRMNLNFEY